MKLNPDCIRDVLLFLEENIGITVYGFAPSSRLEIFKRFANEYSYEDILYSLIQLHENGSIVTDFKPNFSTGKIWLQNVFYITPKGHELISNISDQTRWKQSITPVLKTFGTVSLSVIESISKGVADAYLSKIVLPPLVQP